MLGVGNLGDPAHDANIRTRLKEIEKMSKRKCLKISLILSAVILFTICGYCSTKVGPFFISNKIISAGWRFHGFTDTNTELDPNSCLLIGIPLWHDWDTRITGVAFAPLYFGVDKLNGVSLSCISLANEINGVQIGALGVGGGAVNGVSIAPFSFVASGNCVQIALIAHNGIGRSSGAVWGQIALWNNVDLSSGEAPGIQIGVVNSTRCQRSTGGMNYQIGIVNYESMENGSKNNRKFQFGLINIYAEENGFRESGSKIVQVGIFNFRNGTFCPFVLW